jgi:hypothetical protein
LVAASFRKLVLDPSSSLMLRAAFAATVAAYSALP